MKQMKKWLAGVLTVLLLVNLLPVAALAAEGDANITRAQLAEMVYGNGSLKTIIDSAAAEQGQVTFSDIGSCTEGQKTAINTMAQARVLNGTAAGIFTPNGTVTRAQAAVALWRAAGCLSNKTPVELPYTDITGDLGWAVAALNCLYALGVLERDTTQFRPNDTLTAAELSAWLEAYSDSVGGISGIADSGGISRAEMIVIFYNAYKDALPTLPTTFTSDFNDIADCTDEQKKVITLFHELEYEEGNPIVVGVAEGQFAPFAPVTNIQTAALLQRIIQYIEREKSASAATLSSFGGMELQDIVYDATLQFLMERGLQTASADTIHANPNAPSIGGNVETWSREVEPKDSGSTGSAEEKNLAMEMDWGNKVARLTNLSGASVSVRMVLAAYNTSDRMCGVKTATPTLQAGDGLNITMDVPEGTSIGKLKAFALDPVTRKPLCEAVECGPLSDLTIDEETVVSSNTYQNVTITAAVGDGEVTLEDMTIAGDLIVQGGGSSSIKLDSCTVGGRVVMEKKGGETPRLELTDTPIERVVAKQPAIIEAVDTVSTVQAVTAAASVVIKGAKTAVDVITATAPVTVSGGKVNTITVPDVANQVAIAVGNGASVAEVAVSSSAGAAITNNGAVYAVSAASPAVAGNITITGDNASSTPVATDHIHSWDSGSVTLAPTCTTTGVRTVTCTACKAVKTETVPALGHAYKTSFESSETEHWHVCSRCGGRSKKGAHIYPVNNCAEASKCTACGYEKPAGTHTWGKGVVTKASTFTEPGERTYTCTSCGEKWITEKSPLATDEQLELINTAASKGLLTYLKLNDLDGITRLEMAKLLVAFCGLPVSSTTSIGFSDCQKLSETEKSIINEIVSEGLMAGYNNNEFRPDAVLTRCAAAEIYYRALGRPGTSCTKAFADVKQDQWYWDAVTNLYNLGLITGTSATTFSPLDAADKEAVLSWLVEGKNWQARLEVPRVTGARFVRTNAAIRLEVDPPADMSNIEDLRLEFKDSNGNWVNYGGFRGSGVPIFGDNLNGTYTRLRITSIPKDPSVYRSSVFKMDCNLTVTNTAGSAPTSVAFSEVTSGSSVVGYSAQVCGLSPDTAHVVVELAAESNGDGNRNQMSGNRFSNETSSGKDVTITIMDTYPTNLLPNGYYRVLEVKQASVTSNTEASLTVNTRGGWTKVNMTGSIPSTTTPVPAVEGAAFEQDGPMFRLAVQTPANMDNIEKFRLEFKDSNDNWVDYGSFRGNSLTIYGDGLNGTYTRLRITSIPKDETLFERNAFEMACSLTVNNTTSIAPDAVSFSRVNTQNAISGYRILADGLSPDAQHVVVQLATQAGGRGKRNNLGGNWFYNETAAGKSVNITLFIDISTEMVPDGYYRVLEVKQASVTSSTKASLTVNTRGGWTKVPTLGEITCEPVSDLHFVAEDYPVLTWTRPSTDFVACDYHVYLSTDGGISWTFAHATRDRDFLPPYIFAEGNYNAVKVATVINGQEVASCEAKDLTLEITRNDKSSPAPLTVAPVTNGGYLYTATGLTPKTNYTIFFGSAPGEYNSSRNFRTDKDGNWTQVTDNSSGVRYGYYHIQEYSACSVGVGGKSATLTVSGYGGWETVNVTGTVTYQPVTDLRFAMNMGYPQLTWNIPAAQPSGARYRTYFSKDDGQSWEQVGFVKDGSFQIPYPFEAGEYNEIKVVTEANGREMASATADLSLTITKKTASTVPTLTLTSTGTGGYDCQITGLHANAWFTVFFRDPSSGDISSLGASVSGSDGSFSKNLDIKERYSHNYYIQEYADCQISSQGQVASFAVYDYGGWKQA